MEKYYFFRDLEHEDNLRNGTTFHAAGLVDKINEPNGSGKDVAVSFVDPFEGNVVSAWRAINEVELFEVYDYEWQNMKDILGAYSKTYISSLNA